MGASTVAATLGQVGLPAPLPELAARRWDVVVVGGGHNGLTAAAYLARAGRSVLVLERRERLGGACTLEQPFADPGYLVSPCAYVVGLLDQTVVDELGLERYGYRVFVADPNLWVPFADGTSVAQFVDHDRTVAHLRANRFSERDIQGMLDYEDMFDRLRLALRTGPEGDTWQGDAPTRDQLEKRLGPRPRADLGAVRGVDRRHPRPLRGRPADEGRPVRPGGHRRLGRPQGPGHRLHQADALPGRPGSARARCGATSRAGWAGSRSPSPRPPATSAPSWPPGCRWPRSCPARGCGWRAAS